MNFLIGSYLLCLFIAIIFSMQDDIHKGVSNSVIILGTITVAVIMWLLPLGLYLIFK